MGYFVETATLIRKNSRQPVLLHGLAIFNIALATARKTICYSLSFCKYCFV